MCHHYRVSLRTTSEREKIEFFLKNNDVYKEFRVLTGAKYTASSMFMILNYADDLWIACWLHYHLECCQF